MTQKLFEIGGLEIQVWHLVALVLFVLAVVILAVAISLVRKSAKNKADVKTSTAQPQHSESAEQPQASTDDSQNEEKSVKPTKKPAETKPANAVTVEEVEDEAPDANVEVDETQETEKSHTTKNYHISLREDGKWQVKLSKGGKALKLFDTQAEAIAYAKEKARNQSGHITIHKVNGKIRKQHY